MRSLINNPRNRLTTILSVILAATLLLSLTGFAQAQQFGILSQIPEDANRVVLEQEGVPPADTYVDTYNLMRTADFQIIDSEETLELSSLRDLIAEGDPLVFTAKKQVRDDLALRISFNIETTPGGSKLIASAEYADDVNASIPNWNQATWTDGEAQDAFAEALDIVRHARYDAMDFEIGVAINSQ